MKPAIEQALRDSQHFGPGFLYQTDNEDRALLLRLKE